MIIKNSNIILLHPGKTGGTTLEHTLRDKYMPDVKLDKARIEQLDIMFGMSKKYNFFLQHADLRFFMNELKIDLSSYNTICTVRRPYERLLSCYFYNGKNKLFTFKDFIFKDLPKCIKSNSKYAVNHFCPQYYYIVHNSYQVNNIIKLENIIEESKQKLDLNIKYHYSKTASAKKYSNYLDAYDEEMKQFVYDLYKDDFMLLGYES